MSNKIVVNVICDPINSTWNIMTIDKKCLFYGTVEQLEDWLDDNKLTHEEAKTY